MNGYKFEHSGSSYLFITLLLLLLLLLFKELLAQLIINELLVLAVT